MLPVRVRLRYKSREFWPIVAGRRNESGARPEQCKVAGRACPICAAVGNSIYEAVSPGTALHVLEVSKAQCSSPPPWSRRRARVQTANPLAQLPGRARRGLHKSQAGAQLLRVCQPTCPHQLAPVSGPQPALVTRFGRNCNPAPSLGGWSVPPPRRCFPNAPSTTWAVVLEGDFEHTCAYTHTHTHIHKDLARTYSPEIRANVLPGRDSQTNWALPPSLQPSPESGWTMESTTWGTKPLILARWYASPWLRAVSTARASSSP